MERERFQKSISEMTCADQTTVRVAELMMTSVNRWAIDEPLILVRVVGKVPQMQPFSGGTNDGQTQRWQRYANRRTGTPTIKTTL